MWRSGIGWDGMENIAKVNDLIYAASIRQTPRDSTETPDEPVGRDDESGSCGITSRTGTTASEDVEETIEVSHSVKLLIDATACPQDIAFPTDLKLLNASREKSGTLIDKLYRPFVHGRKKPRTYRVEANARYLDLAKKKVRKHWEIRKAIGQQLRYLRRNLNTIQSLMSVEGCRVLGKRDKRYLETIMKVYEQQLSMYENGTHRVAERIVSIHQPHVSPIVRGKEKSKVEFGSKIKVSLVDGYAFLDHLSWDAYNEGNHLMESVELYRKRHGCYPAEIMVDKIYCNRENRGCLKEVGIKLLGKPLDRSSETNRLEYKLGDRIPINGKFVLAKVRYGMDLIKARLKDTSESWVAMILVVMNMVRLANEAPYFWLRSAVHRLEEIFLNMIRKISVNQMLLILFPKNRVRLFQ